ncbi:MAG: 2-C-methyl-D-erythritol 4-phosphate cytidylyltransferase [Deltaproteobacteria bacterium]|nr:2-C-methyl-D-erythritol 4-phosphate cytidylyltransferase [Deltaproteobacteria bacterium]
MSVAALVLAAGRGERLGADRPKAFVQVAGRALLLHALEALAASQEIDQVIPVLGQNDRPAWGELALQLDSISKLSDPIIGGAERQDSMAAGLAALAADVSHVAVHDAARPLVSPADVDRVVQAAKRAGAAILAVPVRDTIKRVRAGRIVETPPRSECFAAQTPQVFEVGILREALAKAALDGRIGTDEAEIVEALGIEVCVVEGDPGNIKVTDADDLLLAERLLAGRREGSAAE